MREINHLRWAELSNFLKDLSDYKEDYAASESGVREPTQIKEDGRYNDIPYEQWSEEAKEIDKIRNSLLK